MHSLNLHPHSDQHRTHLSQYGGGLAIGGTATLTDTKVYANQAGDRVRAPSAFSMCPQCTSVATLAESYTLFLRQGGGVDVTGTLTMATSTLMANRANKEGANLYLWDGSTTTYMLPAPPGYWVRVALATPLAERPPQAAR